MRGKKKEVKPVSGRRRLQAEVTPTAPALGRRRLDIDTGPDRTVLLRRQQAAARALVFCYYAACALSLLGLLEAIQRFQDPSENGDKSTGLIIGFMILALTAFWAIFTAMSGIGLRRALAKHNVHSIRRKSLTAVVLSVGGLSLLAVKAGNNVLASPSLGIVAVALVLMSTVALASYYTNRFVDA